MTAENTSGTASGITAPNRNTGDTITANDFIQMLNILDNLTDHTHIFYDDYTSVCNCACQCQCGRGSC
jgi:hypothetical protein